jgi:hypothetical protein
MNREELEGRLGTAWTVGFADKKRVAQSNLFTSA